MNKIGFFLIILGIILMNSCAYRATLLPQMNIAGPGTSEDTFRISDYQLVEKQVIGKDSYPIVILFPITGNNQELNFGLMGNAVERACRQGNYAFLSNIRIYQKYFYIPYIFGMMEYDIKGEGWRKIDTSISSSTNK